MRCLATAVSVVLSELWCFVSFCSFVAVLYKNACENLFMLQLGLSVLFYFTVFPFFCAQIHVLQLCVISRGLTLES